MRTIAFTLLCLGACASTPYRVRAPDGQPLSTVARLDANAPPVNVTCGADRYLIVPPSPPYEIGFNVATKRVVVHDLPTLCENIRAN